jgi:hypothetical protein
MGVAEPYTQKKFVQRWEYSRHLVEVGSPPNRIKGVLAVYGQDNMGGVLGGFACGVLDRRFYRIDNYS